MAKNQLNDLLSVARSQIGYREQSNGWTKYGEWYGIPYGNWCAMFISWCAMKAGIGQDRIPKLAYVPYEQEWFAKRGLWHYSSGYRPKSGDLVIYGTNSHIGIVERVTSSSIITIEGNTTSNTDSSNGNGVYRKERSFSHWWISGYCTPKYIIEEEDDMKYYQKISEVPDYARPIIQQMINRGIIKGDNKGLNLSEDNMKMFVYMSRLGLLK